MSVGSDFKKTIDTIGLVFIKQGFVASQKGQVLRKTSENGEFVFHIRFQPVRLDRHQEVTLHCSITVTSERLSVWRLQQYKNKDSESPQVFYTNLKAILPPAAQLVSWKLTPKRQKDVIEEVSDALRYYGLAIFALFEDVEVLLETLGTQAWKLNDYMKAEEYLYPIDFMLCYANKAFTTTSFNAYLSATNQREYAFGVYEKIKHPEFKGFLESNKPIDKALQLAAFHDIPLT